MDFNEYQKQATKTYKLDYQFSIQVALTALAITGEAGEMAEKVKKVLWYNDGHLDRQSEIEIVKELGDILWYISAMSTLLGYDLNEIAAINLTKIRDRASRGVLKGSGDNR